MKRQISSKLYSFYSFVPFRQFDINCTVLSRLDNLTKKMSKRDKIVQFCPVVPFLNLDIFFVQTGKNCTVLSRCPVFKFRHFFCPNGTKLYSLCLNGTKLYSLDISTKKISKRDKKVQNAYTV
jgi:hypothetical protein